MSGGPGYILSKEAVRVLLENALLTDELANSKNLSCAAGYEGLEDLNIGMIRLRHQTVIHFGVKSVTSLLC